MLIGKVVNNLPIDENSKMVLIENLKFYMKKYNKTRGETAELMGVSQVSFSQYMNGKKYPRVEKIKRLADAWGLSVADLVEDIPSVWKEQVKSPAYAKDMWNRMNDMYTEIITPGEKCTWQGVEMNEKTKEVFQTALENFITIIDLCVKD